MNTIASEPTLPESFRTVSVTQSGSWKRLAAYVGPGMMVAVGYMDPGNWATDLAGGSMFGYTLLSVVLISNFLAIFLQYLAIKLGVVTGRDLAQACRDAYSTPVRITLWLLCECAIIACDLAEVIGSAIALQLLFDIPLVVGVVITGLDVLLLLTLQKAGIQKLERLITSIVFLIGGCFLYELCISGISWIGVAENIIPQKEILTNPEMLYVAIGILGATVMPHNLYLHSSLVQTRDFERNTAGKKDAIKMATIDSTVSLLFAFFINAAILILSAQAFFGVKEVTDIHEAYHLLTPALGDKFASTVFAIALLASGQNSTITGTLAGQIVLEGFVRIKIRPWVRRLISRLIALVPAVIVAVLYGEGGASKLLILSQVVLSVQLGFAVFPLVIFTSRKDWMGVFCNGMVVKVCGYVAASIIVGLNAYMLWGMW